MNPFHIIKNGVVGHFSFAKAKAGIDGVTPLPGTEIQISEFANLIVDNGMDMIGSATTDFLQYCQVGSGNSAPLPTDNALVNLVATRGYSGGGGSSLGGYSVTALPYFGWIRRVYAFPAGSAAGNLSEVGVSPDTNGNLFSRALIKDTNGNPTTITILADEVLLVTYEFRVFAPVTDVVSSDLVLDGQTYQVTARPIGFNSGGSSGWKGLSPIGLRPSEDGNSQVCPVADALAPQTAPLFNGPGNISMVGSYQSGTHYRDFRLSLDFDKGNFVGGIGRVHLDTNMLAYQYAFSPKVPKTSDYIFSLDVRVSWARA